MVEKLAFLLALGPKRRYVAAYQLQHCAAETQTLPASVRLHLTVVIICTLFVDNLIYRPIVPLTPYSQSGRVSACQCKLSRVTLWRLCI